MENCGKILGYRDFVDLLRDKSGEERLELFLDLYGELKDRHAERQAKKPKAERTKYTQERFTEDLGYAAASRSEISRAVNDRIVSDSLWEAAVKNFRDDLEMLRNRAKKEKGPLEEDGEVPGNPPKPTLDLGDIPSEEWEALTGTKGFSMDISVDASEGYFKVKGTSCRPRLKQNDKLQVSRISTYHPGLLTVVEKGARVGLVFPVRNHDERIEFDVVSKGFVGDPEGWAPIGLVKSVKRTLEGGNTITLEGENGIDPELLALLPE